MLEKHSFPARATSTGACSKSKLQKKCPTEMRLSSRRRMLQMWHPCKMQSRPPCAGPLLVLHVRPLADEYDDAGTPRINGKSRWSPWTLARIFSGLRCNGAQMLTTAVCQVAAGFLESSRSAGSEKDTAPTCVPC